MSASLGPKLSFISRRFTDDKLDYSDLSSLLSPFQIEKFSFLFKFFDANSDGHVDVSFFS
jgi:Ca2+-binding EF-hand superfamily protein